MEFISECKWNSHSFHSHSYSHSHSHSFPSVTFAVLTVDQSFKPEFFQVSSF